MKENKNILTFDNWQKPERDIYYPVYADPNRSEYNIKVPKQEKFSGAFIVRERLEKLKNLCDTAYWIARSIHFGSVVMYSFSNSSHHYGFVELDFENGTRFVSDTSSPIGLEMFKSLFLGADRIDIKSSDFKHAAIIFYVDNLWVDVKSALNFEQDNLILPCDLEQIWQNLKSNAIKERRDFKNAKNAATELLNYMDLINYVNNNRDLYENHIIQDEFVDKSILSKTMAECNVIRDALFTLHYQCGIGTEVLSSYIDAERSNRIGRFGYILKITSSERFDTQKRIALLKKCIAHCCGFDFGFSGDTGLITLNFYARNQYRKY